MTDTNTTPAHRYPKTYIRCMGIGCRHSPGTCTASPEYQAEIAPRVPTTPATDDEREGLAMVVSTRTFAFFDGDEDCGDWPEMSERARNIYREAADAALAYLAPIRAREIAAAEARGVEMERARVVAWLPPVWFSTDYNWRQAKSAIARREHAQEAGNERNHG